MKIAFINIYQNSVARGAETFVYEVSKRLKQKHSLTIISENNAKPSTKWPFLWRFFLDPAGLMILLFTLKKLPLILKEKYDIVVPVNGGWQPALVRLATWLYGGKMVISGQAGMGWDERNNLWCFPDTFVALSSKAQKWAKKVNPAIRTVYIPNGVDTRKFTPEGHSYKTRLPKPIILCVGALTKSKRIDLTIKAASRLEASLLVVGDGDWKEKIESLGKRLLGKRFQLTKVSFSHMPEVYRTADVFTLASEPFHAFEIVLVEAMASGLAVVANKDEIRREIVGRAGILVDPTNTQAYAIALENAMRLKWGKRPQNQARKFDWDKIADSYEALFKKLCSV